LAGAVFRVAVAADCLPAPILFFAIADFAAFVPAFPLVFFPAAFTGFLGEADRDFVAASLAADAFRGALPPLLLAALLAFVCAVPLVALPADFSFATILPSLTVPKSIDAG